MKNILLTGQSAIDFEKKASDNFEKHKGGVVNAENLRKVRQLLKNSK